MSMWKHGSPVGTAAVIGGKYQSKVTRLCDSTFETKVTIVYDSFFYKTIFYSLLSFIVITNHS